MLNEQEREDGPEEGEYHFSDEGGYESNMEEESRAPVLTETGGLVAKFSSYRRIVMMGAGFAVVLLIGYMLVPALTSTSIPTEIRQVAVVSPTVLPVPSTMHRQQAFSKPLPIEKTETTVAAKQAIQETPVPVSAPQISVVAPPPSPVVGAVTSPQPKEAAISSDEKAALTHLTLMGETNAKVLDQLQLQYAQKLMDYETQNKLMQEQVRTLNTRLAAMEAEMSKLVQVLNKQPQAQAIEKPVILHEAVNASNMTNNSAVAATLPSMQASSSKLNYTVQAIIPGRAWLRTESGETITVAEGDLLKSLGRVIKIDPYDGIIQIDVGNKIVTLTYGNGDYA